MQEDNVRHRGAKGENSSGDGEYDGTGDSQHNLQERQIIEAPDWSSGLKGYERDVGKSVSQRIFHWGTLTAIGIVLIIGVTTTYIHLQWWPVVDIKAVLHLSLFLFFNYYTLNNLSLAAYIGPGYVPLHWNPPKKEYESSLQYCVICEGYKVPRSHHCSRCSRCVMKMDHHCPWINNCVGHRNHAYFIRFLAAAVIGCIHAVYICGSGLYYAMFRLWYLRYGTGNEPDVVLTLNSFLATFFAFGLALGVIIAVGFLLCVQLRVIWRNRTGVEDYIIGKAESYPRRFPFIYPYDLGWRRNILEVLGTWNGRTKGTGVWWPVVAPSDQFTFSEEQLYQKQLKREHAREYVIIRDHPGGVFRSIKLGLRVFCCQPWSDETRVPIQIGQHWMVTRGNKYWLYGRLKVNRELKAPADIRSVPRGWFPKICAERHRA